MASVALVVRRDARAEGLLVTYLLNDPAHFAEEFAAGFAAANGRWVRRVPGGVVRASRRAGRAALVIGGGSGHYPAFAGLVGQGLAQGAAMGNLFASPSAEQVYQVAKAADSGGGILLSYGNYAGDVLNFDQAQERLRAEGVTCRTVVVTDDVSSAPANELAKRRGIAGDLVVFKAAGAAAEHGADLDEVVRIAEKANGRTRSFGVAFSGCTLPGAAAPLFTVPRGRMAVGMGIHGEPGIGESAVPTADDLAALLVETVLGESPADADGRAAVILNGLGSVKYEELFVLYGRVHELLAGCGVTVVEPEVGELVTSLAMAGVSLTVCWLDQELEELWRAPAAAPAYRKGSVEGPEPSPEPTLVAGAAVDVRADTSQASPESRAAAALVLDALRAASRAIDQWADELGRLDAVAGDGDHGLGMQRGAGAGAEAAEKAMAAEAGAGTVLDRAGAAWADHAGGTSGALWGLALRALGAAVGDDSPPRATTIVAGVRDAQHAIMRTGKAGPGDKTLLDTLVPFADALENAVRGGDRLAEAWDAASRVADSAAADTAALVPRVGRARPHADKSVGTPDPGAVSMAVVIGAVRQVLLAKGSGRE